ncbi:hypothetical protein UFOVP891_16 [uncultured Caudovirales phage]|uniref:Uncharacterized protein n=1 Tax=uncultured Caudovirales phage TaxID=2100421 RepID=A0A6J5PCY4_9CAUD|nr:hypothetical protein UFOVP472_52 [uncultured Caudovirales phage]CAB4168982.1 hypothetical protein UFOVP891_16 [uncultured Caudovirales phage]CAB4180792.1 hypothetical protein UFOVP1053_52 [uncultured Caudovirales phage]CAB4195581.1 hypothetical protein UFOVP1297_22 [uncultured Caudovirales phage]CAB4221926.1 hypothetical protein UFOVP1647_62 [uncultured Caudovirales phage]
MSLPGQSVHVRLSPEAFSVVTAMAEINERGVADQCHLLLEKILLGEIHVLSMTQKKWERLGKSGSNRE